MNLEHLKYSLFGQLFKKYLFILLVFAILNFVISMLEPLVIAKFFLSGKLSDGYDIYQSFWFQNFIYLLRIFFNLLTMMFLFVDLRKLNLNLWTLLLLSLIEREIAVVLFLAFVLYQENFKGQGN